MLLQLLCELKHSSRVTRYIQKVSQTSQQQKGKKVPLRYVSSQARKSITEAEKKVSLGVILQHVILS